MPQADIETLVVAGASVFMYLALGCTSIYYFLSFNARKFRAKSNEVNLSRSGAQRQQYADSTKQIFFAVLTASSLLDVPFYVACLFANKDDCLWFNTAHTIVWSLHLLALIGYGFTLGIPLYLVSEIINGRDGRLFANVFQYDSLKMFWYFSIFLYFALQITTIVAIGITGREDFSNKLYYSLTAYIESAVITSIALVWLLMGLRLRQRLMRIQFSPEIHKKILNQVIVVLFCTTISFIVRAILLVCSNYDMIQVGGDFPYILWALLTRWLPYIVCSFLMINVLRRSKPTSEEKTTVNAVFLPDDFSVQSSDLLLSLAASGQDEKETFEGDFDDDSSQHSFLSATYSVLSEAHNL